MVPNPDFEGLENYPEKVMSMLLEPDSGRAGKYKLAGAESMI